MYIKKYTKGDPIISLDELAKQKVIYFGNKVQTFGWFQNFQLIMLIRAIERKAISKAIKKEEEEK